MPESHGCQDPIEADSDPVQELHKINCITNKSAGMYKEYNLLTTSSFFLISRSFMLVISEWTTCLPVNNCFCTFKIQIKHGNLKLFGLM